MRLSSAWLLPVPDGIGGTEDGRGAERRGTVAEIWFVDDFVKAEGVRPSKSGDPRFNVLWMLWIKT
jgi:hypothetical protein